MRCAFDLAYAAQYFHAEERRVFLAAANTHEHAVAASRLAGFAPLFELERRRQRRAATSSITTTAGARSAA